MSSRYKKLVRDHPMLMIQPIMRIYAVNVVKTPGSSKPIKEIFFK